MCFYPIAILFLVQIAYAYNKTTLTRVDTNVTVSMNPNVVLCYFASEC